MKAFIPLVLATSLAGCSYFDKQSHAASTEQDNPPQQETSTAPQHEHMAPQHMSRQRSAEPARVAPLSEDTVRNIQTKLRDQNLYHGPIDGLWGADTKSSLRDFQLKNNINPTGELDPSTINALKLS